MPEVLDPPEAEPVVRRFRVMRETIQRFEPADHSIIAQATYSGNCGCSDGCSKWPSCAKACIDNPPD